MESAIDPELMRQLGELASLMQDMFPTGDLDAEYPFMGDEPLTLQRAMEVIGDLRELDELEEQIQEVMRRGNIQDLDPNRIEEHLGGEARRQLEELQRIVQQLEEAGYLRDDGDRLGLTPRGIRKLGYQALHQVFSELKKDRLGRHVMRRRGEGGEVTGETKGFEFGDPFDIDLHRTLFNAVQRGGPEIPVRLSPEDLEVRRTEHLTQAATVLLLDLSRSMGMFGNFAAAKRVALALYQLVHSRFPRDYFGIVGFSDYAVEVKGEDVAELTWNAWVSGTNMHHALMIARRLLSRQKAATRQVLMVTDGEPTAHLQDGRSYFSYPPSYDTVSETLKEVKRCTQEGVTINVFMLEASHHLMDFVDRLTRINRGRAFYTTSGQLGRYVMVDYLKGRTRRV